MSAGGRAAWTAAAIGVPTALVAAVLAPGAAAAAAAQDWPPFVLVAGLLLVGLVAAEDGVFEAAGSRLASTATNGVILFAGAMVLVSVVTALLNLDTSVAFLTPVLVAAGRARQREPDGASLETPLLYGCLLLSNAASLLLPGSNLTNLIVLGHLHLAGGQFARHMAAPWLASAALTAVAVGLLLRRHLVTGRVERGTVVTSNPTGITGLLAVAAATVVILTDSSPALPVVGIGLLGALVRFARRTTPSGIVTRLLDAVGGPVLVGLLGIAIGAGTIGRVWSGPATVLHHLDAWGSAAFAAALAVTVNNLPAASLLAARHPPHPFATLVGLDLGPNLFVTGSLSSFLWWQSARSAGARPSVATVSRLGIVSGLVAGATCVALLLATGTR